MVADKDGSGDPHVFGIPIKYFVLVLLTVQNAGAVLMMRFNPSQQIMVMLKPKPHFVQGT